MCTRTYPEEEEEEIPSEERSDAGAKRWLNHWRGNGGCSVPCAPFPPAALTLSRSALSFSHSSSLSSSPSEHPSSFSRCFSLPNVRAFSRSSLLVVRPRGAYNPTLRRRPRLVVIAYTRNTQGSTISTARSYTILRPKLSRTNISQERSVPSSSLSRTRKSSRREIRAPLVYTVQRWGFLIDMISHTVVLTPKWQIRNLTARPSFKSLRRIKVLEMEVLKQKTKTFSFPRDDSLRVQ